MSRLTEITDNHNQLNELLTILKHYAVSAEFVSFALIEQFTQKTEEQQDSDEDQDMETDQQYTTELLEDLNQFHARF